MRILFVTSAYPTCADDPRGIFVHRLARGLVREGIAVTVVAPGASNASSISSLEGVRVERATYWIKRWQTLAEGVEGIVPRIRARPWRAPMIPILFVSLTAKAIRLAPRYDLVHAHWLYPAGMAGAAAARRHHLPLVVTARGGDLALAQSWKLLAWLSRWVIGQARACIGVSQHLCDALRRLGSHDERTHQIASGVEIDSDTSQPDDPIFSAFAQATGIKLLFVGSLIRRKSVETLLGAHAELVRRGISVCTAIVGSGERGTALRRQADGLPGVLFAQARPPQEIPHWMLVADALVLPSLSEGRPNVIAEAMSLGTRVIATDIPGNRELVIHDDTGYLFPPGNAIALSDTVKRMAATSVVVRHELIRRSKDLVLNKALTTAQVVSEHVELYLQLTSSARLPRAAAAEIPEAPNASGVR